jgi:hypothetical protein
MKHFIYLILFIYGASVSAGPSTNSKNILPNEKQTESNYPSKVDKLIQNNWTTFSWPYNAYMPSDDNGVNGKVGIGCGPTAIARLIGYWKHVPSGSGHIKLDDYWGFHFDCILDSLDLNYSNMPNELNWDAPESKYKDIAKLFYASASIDAEIRTGFTHGIKRIPDALSKYFHFDSNAKVVYRLDYTKSDWIDIFKKELSEGRPILIDGRTSDSPAPDEEGGWEGHFFICDGYDNDKFYYNYSFGNITGWADIDSMGKYLAHHRAIIGLQPDYYLKSSTKSICEGETYRYGAQELTESGEYTEVFMSSTGCDSTVVLTLTVNPTYNGFAQATICEGNTYQFGSQIITAPGEYKEVFSSSTGCDSIVVLTLAVSPAYNEFIQATICEGETYRYGAQELTESGEYTEVFMSSTGCDSTVVLTLTVNTLDKPVIIQEADTLICNMNGVCNWYRNNKLIEGATSPKYIVEKSGNYQVIFINENDCYSPMSESLYVTITSIPDLTFSENISVFPNPAINEITIEGLDTATDTYIQIFNSSGKNVHKRQLKASKKEINIRGLPEGLYNLVIIQGNNKAAYKIIKM